jgi:hypothetical protein
MLGPFEIVAPLGAAGMGEVYRARDTRLERTVAGPLPLAQVLKFGMQVAAALDRAHRSGGVHRDCSNESGEYKVDVVPFPGPGGEWRVSPAGGMRPALAA